jgi:HEAT repeat protein
MPLVTPDLASVSPGEAARAADFARACKAAARAVTLYPDGHPAIAFSLSRLVTLTSPKQLAGPLRFGVLADGLLLERRALPRTDAAIADLAALLHAHLIGELTVEPGADRDAWAAFLRLLGRPVDAVRGEGGIGRLWEATGHAHVGIREIDYAHVLRERRDGVAAAWERIVDTCLRGDTVAIGGEALQHLLETATDTTAVRELVASIEGRAGTSTPVGLRTAAIVRLLQGIADTVAAQAPSSLEAVLRDIASALDALSPELLAAFVSDQGRRVAADSPAAGSLVDSIVSRVPDHTIAAFVARNAFGSDSSLARVAQAVQTLVHDREHGERLLALAHDRVLETPFGSEPGFEERWNEVAERVLTSYSDKPFVSDDYARELTGVGTRAIQLDELHDDPPERIAGWLETVATSELRRLDLDLLHDLLRIEDDPARWSGLMPPVLSLLDDLFFVTDFEPARQLVQALANEAQDQGDPARMPAAQQALDSLAGGPMVRHLAAHVAGLDPGRFEQLKAMCLAVGNPLIRPLAEAVAAEERAQAREKLAAILAGFGAAGRHDIERLKSSPNAAVRRTAVYLLGELGGTTALADLKELLHDRDAQVQRAAIRAILAVGSEAAFTILTEALVAGTDASRDATLQALSGRDERLVPLFVHIVAHADDQGPLAAIYVRAIEGLGSLKSAAGIPALRDALYRGKWWSRRSAVRQAAARALARIGTDAAVAVLDEAARGGPRGVRAAARAAMATQSGGRS